MKTNPRLVPAVLAAACGLALATLNSGCFAVVAAGAGAGAVAYIRGDLESSVDAGFDKSVKAAERAIESPVDGNFDRAVRASQRAIEQLKFAKVNEKQDALLATLVARNADDKRIEIRVESDGTARTKLRIRVGVIGDEALSLAILEKIKGNL